MKKPFKSYLLCGTAGVVGCLVASWAVAQTFSPGALSAPQKVAPAMKLPASEPKKETQPEILEGTIADVQNAFVTNSEERVNPEDLFNAKMRLGDVAPKQTLTPKTETKEEDIFIPEGELYRLNTPTKDGSVRGGQAFVEVDEKGRMKKASNIFLFYDQFEITNYLSSSAGCNVRFNLLSNLDQKITNLDVKLVWPGLTTTLSFSNVSPNTQTYYNYALIGDGCYNMDKAPNIIVNRCRVKGMTAAECANKIIWLSK